MKHGIKTIFRVVGGQARRSVLEEYAIIPYLVMKETDMHYWTANNGRWQKQHKRTTSNSAWFENIDNAIGYLVDKIETELHLIRDSYGRIDFSPKRSQLFIGRFDRGKFSLQSFYILKHTKTAVKIDVPKGKEYIYPHVSEPHNPARPYERWIGEDIYIIQQLMHLYYETRIKYLQHTIQHQREWVRLYLKERAYEQENG